MTLTTTTLPLTVTKGRTAVAFELDALVGPRINQITDDSSLNLEASTDVGDSFSALGGTIRDVNGTMWVIRGVDQSGAFLTVTGADAELYQVYDAVTLSDGSEANIFEWRGISTGAVGGDKLWVRVAAIDPDSGDGVRWAGWFGRESGASFRVTEFAYPAINLTSYAEAGSGTYIEKAYRQRLIVANATPLLDGTNAYNRNVGMMAARRAVFGAERVTGHPAPGLHMPWWATVGGNPSNAATYRKVFMVRAEDQDIRFPYFKRLRWRVLDTGSAATMKMHFAHCPRLAAGFGLRNENPRGDHLRLHLRNWDNSDGPTWTPVTETFLAADQNWWYDCCEKHRTWYQAQSGFLPVRQNPYASPLRTGGLLATSLHGRASGESKEVADASEAAWTLMERTWFPILAEYLKNQSEFPVEGRLGYHRQNPSLKWWGTLSQPDRDFDTLVTHLPETINLLNTAGWKQSIYTIWVEFLYGEDADNWGWTSNEFVDSITGVDEFGQATTRSSTTSPPRSDESITNRAVRLIQERPEWVEAVRAATKRIAERLNLTGIYFDVFGAAAQLHSNHDTIEPWGHNQYVEFEQQAIKSVKDDFGSDFLVLTESVTEGMTAADAASESFNLKPFLQMNWEDRWESFLAGGNAGAGAGNQQMLDTPIQMRDPTVPLWQATHNIDQPSFAFNVVSTLGYHENSPLMVSGATIAEGTSGGLTTAEWTDVNCFGHACTWVVGHKPLNWEERTNFDLTPIVTSGGVGKTGYDGAGPAFMTFFLELYRNQAESLAGKFIVDGNMLRPMIVDYDDAQVQMEDNPGAPFRLAMQTAGIQVVSSTFTFYPVAFNQNSPVSNDVFTRFVDADNQVPAVLHTMWKSTIDDSVGCVLVNWTSAAADWEGTFTPALFGLSEGVDITITRRGATISPISNVTGSTFTVRSDATSGGDAYIGHLPARSITILEFSN
jgi:hypothetical protein